MSGISPGQSLACESFDDVYRKIFPRLVASLRFAGAGDDAEDVAQEALTRTAQRFERLTDPASYTYRIAFRLLLRSPRHRMERLRRRLQQQRQVHDATFEQGEQDIDLRRALDQLPPRQRACAVLVLCELFTPSEAAAVLRVAPSTVRSNLTKARPLLKRALNVTETGSQVGGVIREVIAERRSAGEADDLPAAHQITAGAVFGEPDPQFSTTWRALGGAAAEDEMRSIPDGGDL